MPPPGLVVQLLRIARGEVIPASIASYEIHFARLAEGHSAFYVNGMPFQ